MVAVLGVRVHVMIAVQVAGHHAKEVAQWDVQEVVPAAATSDLLQRISQ